MSIIREKIKYLVIPTGTTQVIIPGHSNATGITGIVNIKFDLSSNDNFLGYQQEIDDLTQGVSNTLINPDVDLEERRFKYAFHSPAVQFNFGFGSPTAYNDFAHVGFTVIELEQQQLNVLNSFFIFELYDTYDVSTQVKILTTYITKIGNLPQYTLDLNNQIYNLYVPLPYIQDILAQSGSTGIATGYTKISFYNAKTGKVILFYNPTYALSTTPLFMFFPTRLNVNAKTWEFLPASTTVFQANEIYQNPAYVTKVNDTVNNFNNEAQDYPSGSTFVYTDGKYTSV
jgi:hypothetical protein